MKEGKRRGWRLLPAKHPARRNYFATQRQRQRERGHHKALIAVIEANLVRAEPR